MTRKAATATLTAFVLAFTAASAAAKDEVKVGFIGPLTGGVSVNGIGGRNSADLAVKLRNADAKTKYDYQLVVLDDECKPNVAVQAATKMAADNEIIAAATHYCSATAIATVDTYHKFGFPVIVWGAVLPDITYRNKYAEVHRVNGTMINQNEANAALISKLGYKTVAVIHDTTDYGKGHNQYFSEALARLGKAKIVGTFGVTADQQDFTAELTQIKALNPQVIYFGGLTPIGVRIRSQMDKLGIKALFDGTSGIVSEAFIQGLGPLAEGTLAFREGAPTEKLPRRQVLHGEIRRPALRQSARSLWPVRLCRDGPDPRHHRKRRARPQEGDRRARQRERPRFDRRQDHLRRSRAEHRAGDHRLRRAGRQVRGMGRQRIRERQARASRPEIALAARSAASRGPGV